MSDDAVVPLRLPGSPSSTHVDDLRLEDALNALGRQDYPAEWGRLPGWSQMPFRWHSETRKYVRHELRLIGRLARLRRMPVTLKLTKAEKKACIALYRQVRGILREALEQGHLHARAMHHATGERSPITAPCIWHQQVHLIFFTGRTVLREPEQADRLADVVLQRKNFDRWLADRARAQAKTASVKMLRDVGAAIAAHEQEHGCEIIRSEALNLVTQIALRYDKHVPVAWFKEHVWKPRGATAGARTKVQQAHYRQHEEALKTRLDAVIGGASKT